MGVHNVVESVRTLHDRLGYYLSLGYYPILLLLCPASRVSIDVSVTFALIQAVFSYKLLTLIHTVLFFTL